MQIVVEPEYWPEFLIAYGREHQGWPTALEAESQRRDEPRYRPLQSMSCKNRGSLFPVVAVNFRDGGSICISGPQTIRQVKDRFGYHEGLEIRTGDGWVAVRFGQAAVGLIDGAR